MLVRRISRTTTIDLDWLTAGDNTLYLAAALTDQQTLAQIYDARGERGGKNGHMLLCQGVVAAWRNPWARSLVDDQPSRALMMIESIGDLIAATKSATRPRRRKSP